MTDADDSADLTATRMLPVFVLFVVVGAPLVYLVWRFVNELLLGIVDPAAAGLALAGLVGLLGLLSLVARQIGRWEEP